MSTRRQFLGQSAAVLAGSSILNALLAIAGRRGE